MAKLPADITIRIKSSNGPAAVLELIHVIRGRCWIRRDGRRSSKTTYTTPTDIGRDIGRWVSNELPRVKLRDLQRPGRSPA